MQLTGLAAAEQQVREEAAAGAPEFTAFLDGFRHRPVLVPFDDQGGLWSAELGGIRWILAFSDEKALTRLEPDVDDPAIGLLRPAARTGDDGRRVVEHRKVLGWKLLDYVVPAAGRPCGVVLDADENGGKPLPPVAGIVPERATLDAYASGTHRVSR